MLAWVVCIPQLQMYIFGLSLAGRWVNLWEAVPGHLQRWWYARNCVKITDILIRQKQTSHLSHPWADQWRSSTATGPDVWASVPVPSCPACGKCSRFSAWPRCGSPCGSTPPGTSDGAHIHWRWDPQQQSPPESEPVLWRGQCAPLFPLHGKTGRSIKYYPLTRDRTIHHYAGQRPVEGSRGLTFCILQDPLQKNWVLCYSLGYQQDALWDLSAPHQGVSTLLLKWKF